jgi:hypothetical protein
MTHLPLAFSIHHFISSVGADAGFASIIGLAILVLLYFAQARETATLRERADAAEQHAAQLEASLSQIAQATRAQAQGQGQPAGPRPVPSPIARPLANPAAAASPAAAAAATAGATAAAGGAIPAAPAGVGAPALTAATRLIPMPVGAGAAPPEAPPATAKPAAPPPPVAAPGPAPATAAGAASATAVASPPAAPPTGGGNGSSGDTAHAPLLDDPLDEPSPRVQLRSSGGGARQLPPLRPPPSSRGPSRLGRGLAMLLAVLGVAAVIAILLIATSGGGKHAPSSASSTSNAPSGRHKARSKGFDKGAVTVTVLNGTGTSGLAAGILSQVGHDGFKKGTAANAANATQTTTVVAYLQGQKAGAQAVAKALKLPTSAVAPIDSDTQSIACPQSTCNVDVVVTVGQDLVGH